MNLNEIKKRLEEIEMRVNAATPGPWKACTYDPMHRPHVCVSDLVTRYEWADIPKSKEDAEFVAHAREDVPWLCQIVRRLIGQVEDLEVKNSDLRLAAANALEELEDALMPSKRREQMFAIVITAVNILRGTLGIPKIHMEK